MVGEFVILERLDPLYRIEVRDPAALDVEIRGRGGPRTRVTLSIWIFAGMSLGTKLFWFASMGMSGSIWNPITAMSAAMRRIGTGFFAIFMEVLVRN